MDKLDVILVVLTISSVLSSAKSTLIVERLGLNETLTKLDSKDEKIFGFDWLFPQESVSSLCDAQCGIPYNEKMSRIIGGVETTPNQYPWMVLLEIVSRIPFKITKSRCGGTLIKDRYVLTASHCVASSDVVAITAYIGHHYIDTTKFEKTGHEIILPVIKVTTHKDFDPYTMQNDLAILELASAVRFTDQVHTLCLSQKEPSISGVDAVVAGWGSAKSHGTVFIPQMLLHATVPLVDLKQCRKALYSFKSMIADRNICAGGKANDSCQGDSGGPLFRSSDSIGNSKRYNLIGVTSWGVGCGQEGLPGVYATIWNQLPWIQAATPKNKCSPTAPLST